MPEPAGVYRSVVRILFFLLLEIALEIVALAVALKGCGFSRSVKMTREGNRGFSRPPKLALPKLAFGWRSASSAANKFLACKRALAPEVSKLQEKLT